jgi:hypothetical protein
MPPTGNIERRRSAIRAKLEQHPGSAADAALGVWRELAGCLEPMIGPRGVEALFGRSLQLTATAYSWLVGAPEPGADPLMGLAAALEAHDPVEAAAASLALLVTFTDLLAGMIGASLTDRLLDPVWAAPAPASAQETPS